MAVSIKHKFVSEVADGADEDRVQPSDWNDEHEVEGLGDLAALDTVDSDQIEDAAVTDGKLRNSAALSVIGRSANSSGDPGDIAASANAQMLGRLSDALGFSSVSAFLDAAFSSTRGAVLYRGASAWAALAPGDAGKVFTTNGAGADPTWETASGGGGSPIGFRAFRTSSQSFSSGNFTKVQFNNEAFDLGSHYSTSNHRWTPPAGLVLLVFAVRFQDNRECGVGNAHQQEWRIV